MSILWLFDVDGTLLRSNGAGSTAMTRAFRDVFGVERAFAAIAFAGMTDLSLLAAAMARHGLGEAGQETRTAFFGRYLDHLDRTLSEASPYPLAGVQELLAALSARGHGVGLLTGNIREGCRRKLAAVGLAGAFEFGAYGDEAAHRPDLLPIALGRAPARYRKEQPGWRGRVVVVGDTPADVGCARAHGVVSLAVATGWHDEAALRGAGATIVVTSLAGADALIGQVEAGLGNGGHQ